MKNGKLENPAPAHSLLAKILTAGGTARLSAGRLEVGPPNLANKLRDRIIACKPDLVRLLLGGSCVSCGFRLKMQGKSRILEENGSEGLKTRKFVTEQYCENCGKRGPDHIQPDFPVFDKSGKEI